MRSFNEGWALRETLSALEAQNYRNWELIVIDSGSTDGSVELLRQAQPRYLIQIKPQEYNPGRVMNHGMSLARSEFGIFLNADATPQGSNWLRPLVQALQEPETAAVFGRQIPRPDCRAVFAHDYERCFGSHPASATWEHFFSMVSSGVRKDVWSQRRFLETIRFSEDDEFTRWCRNKGYQVRYCPESVVMHSHNYTPAQAYQRSFGEATTLAAVWSRNPSQINWVRTFLIGWLNNLRRDIGFCIRNKRLSELPHACCIRWQQRRAKVQGFRVGWKLHRGLSVTAARCHSSAAKAHPLPRRFTIDGNEQLERRLADLCASVLSRMHTALPPGKLRGLVLGGGYGRGEGGVLRTAMGEEPYNDLEFYAFLKGARLANEQRFRARIEKITHELSGSASVHVEVKIESLRRLRYGPVSMFSYDLVSGHKLISGDADLFAFCNHHLNAQRIPLEEATRLLFNRCTGLLLVKELLLNSSLTSEEADFIGRNLAKLQLALGDSLLAAFGQYHWSCLERQKRLRKFTLADSPPWLDAIRQHHDQGIEFKLQPQRVLKSGPEFQLEAQNLSALALSVWLWIENRRLGINLSTPEEYAFSTVVKSPGSNSIRNYLLNLRSFGAGAGWDLWAKRYPRERLLNSLTLLLWKEDAIGKRQVLRHIQNCLKTRASDWLGLVSAYKNRWAAYG